MKLAIDGGNPFRTKPLPERCLITDQDLVAINDILKHAIDTGFSPGYGGPQENKLCSEFCSFMGGGYADGMNSGTSACLAAIFSLNLESGGEIIVPPITDAGPTMAVAFMGFLPVPADSDEKSFNISGQGILKRVNNRTKAIMVAHIPGEPADMDEILSISHKTGLPIIEDCSQAYGARYRNSLVGTFGNVAFFSTMHTKLLSTGGQGGLLFTKDKNIYERAKVFADRGKPLQTDIFFDDRITIGLNLNMDEISATIGISQLQRLTDYIDNRRKVASYIKDGIKERKAISLGWLPAESEPSYWFLRFRIDENLLTVKKDYFCKAISAEGIRAVPNFPMMPTEKTWFKSKKDNNQWPWCSIRNKDSLFLKYDIPNAIKAEKNHFRIGFNENWGKQEANDLIYVLEKVENAFLL